ncbi:MAG: ABC transporter substrate-binding protein [Mycobacteriales bacterium]
MSTWNRPERIYRPERILRGVAVIGTVTLLAAACGSSGTSAPASKTSSAHASKTLNIGVEVALTGGAAPYGIGYEKGIELAIKDINAAGGLPGGVKLVPKVVDQGSGPTAVTEFENLVTQDHVPAVIGVNSKVIVSLVPVAERYKTVLIGPAAGTDALNGLGGNYVYRYTPSDNADGLAVVVFLKGQGLPRVVTVTEGGTIYSSPTQAFKAAYQRAGGTVIKDVALLHGESNYATQADQVVAANSKWVYVAAGVNTGSSFIKALKAAGYKGHLMLSAELVVPQTITTTGATLMEGTFGEVATPNVTVPAYKAYGNEWASTYGGPPAPYSQAAYSAMVTVALAMVAGHGTSGATVNREMRVVTGTSGVAVDSFAQGVAELRAGHKIHYVGPTGPVVFSKHGSAQAGYGIYEVKNGSWQVIRSFPASDFVGIR